MGQHQLTCDNTLWIFASCSQEVRHLEDIVFAVDALRRRGVDDKHIVVFTDHPKVSPHLGPYSIGNTFPIAAFAQHMASAEPHQYAVVVVGGHGHEAGLGATPTPPSPAVLPPHQFFSAVRGIPGLALGVVVLAQCFGGVFNFVDAAAAPPLVVIGATNLNPSLSMSVQLVAPLLQSDGTVGLKGWSANVFMLSLFTWFRTPTDIDGDGCHTLMDAYKFAGAFSNSRLRSAKAPLFINVRKLADDLEKEKGSQSPDALRIQALDTQLRQSLGNLYLHQEPWVLHANLARDVHFT